MKEKNQLRKVREERLLGKAELAREAGVSVLTITRIENGEASRPKTKRQILAALNIPLEDRERVFPGDPDS